MNKKNESLKKAFREARNDVVIEWVKQNSILVGMILLLVIIFVLGIRVASEEKEYDGTFQGIVINVYQQQKNIIGPELNRFVKIELNNGDTHITKNDTLNVGDQVTAERLLTEKNRYTYFIKRNQ